MAGGIALTPLAKRLGCRPERGYIRAVRALTSAERAGARGIAAALLLAAACRDAGPPPLPCSVGGAPRSPEVVVLAGSGVNLAPVRVILEALRARGGGPRARLAASIGTGGALRALRDGAIDVGLVSRPLSAGDLGRDLRLHALGTVPLAIVAHRSTRAPAELTPRELAAYYRGTVATWPGGAPVIPLVRQAGDSTMREIAAVDRALAAAMAEARAADRALTCYTDQQMRDALLAIPGAIGFLDLGTIRLERLAVQVLRLRRPADGDASAPRLSLGLLTRAAPREPVRRLLDFVRGYRGAQLVAAGYALTAPPAAPDAGP